MRTLMMTQSPEGGPTGDKARLAGDGGRQGGNVLILVLFFVVLIGFYSASLSSVTQVRSRASAETVWASSASYTAEGAIEFAYARIWEDYLALNDGDGGPIGGFKDFLEDPMGLNLFNGGVADLTSQAPVLGIPLTSLTVRREDLPSGLGIDLTVEARLNRDGTALVFTRTLRAEGEDFAGFDFAVFSNNVNCIFCHAQIDSVDKYSGGPYERVKVATLESLLVRTAAADSTIAGTLYVRGALTDKTGNPLTTLAGTTVTGYQYDADGNLITDAGGNLIGTDFIPGDNMWLDYPVDPALQPDGDLPDSFPPPFPDENGNNLVDDAEYGAVAADSTGAISGGMIYQVPLGGMLGGVGLPAVGNTASVAGQGAGNMVLVGTDADPIVLDGQVTVPGDLIIKGVVKGSGSLYVRGNVYVVGDLTYADGVDASGNRTFGIAADGTPNSLGLTSGGNILIGDYLTPKSGDVLDPLARTTGAPGGDFSFALSEVALFNRREWAKTQPMLPGPGGTPVTNSTYEPGYEPRYYVQNPGSPVAIFQSSQTYWDPINEAWAGKEHPGSWSEVAVIDPASLPPGAAVVPLSSGGDWVGEQQLKEIWIDDENQRALGEEFKIDSLLYTNRSIFALTRNRTNSEGRMVINGGLVAADLGILAAGPDDGRAGLELNYDQRVTEFLSLPDTTSTTLTRKATWLRREAVQ
ncbi:MAG: hypothetical protein ACE5GW_05245 [Planctomycetota bacterium]